MKSKLPAALADVKIVAPSLVTETATLSMPEPASVTFHVKVWSCPSFWLPCEPPRTISGGVVSSSLTTTLCDAELLSAIAAGSEAAFEELRQRYRRAIEHVCCSVAPPDREDCAQEIFARVWRKASLFDPSRGSASAWLLTLARHTAINFQSVRHGWPPAELASDMSAVDPPDVDAFWLESALERLPERQRTVIELAYYDDMSERAIAAQLRVALGSVKSWKRRGLNRLATMLGEDAP